MQKNKILVKLIYKFSKYTDGEAGINFYRTKLDRKENNVQGYISTAREKRLRRSQEDLVSVPIDIYPDEYRRTTTSRYSKNPASIKLSKYSKSVYNLVK